MFGLVPSTIILLAFIHGILGSAITSFKDDQCKVSQDALKVENGYPDGICTELKVKNVFEAFQIVQLDPGCAVTLYGPDSDSNQPCSSSTLIVGELAACYNTSWHYFSVDGCDKPSSSSSSALVLPTKATGRSSTSSVSSTTLSTSSSSTSTSASSTPTPIPPPPAPSNISTGALVGAIIGSVAFCAALIALLLYCLHHRKTRAPKEIPPSYELSQERALNEMPRGSVAPVVPVARKEMWGSEVAVEIGENSYVAPVELDGEGGRERERKVGEIAGVGEGERDRKVGELARMEGGR